MARRPGRRRGEHRQTRRPTRRRYEYDGDVYYVEEPPPFFRLCFICFLTVGVAIFIARSDRQGIPLHPLGELSLPPLPDLGPPPDPHAEKKSFLSLFAQDEKFEKSKFDYGIPGTTGKAEEHTLPPPKATNQTTVVIVLSSRTNFERREAIRETWARDNDNVYFVIGGPDPEDFQDKNLSNPLSVSSLLKREQELYGDMIDAIHPESYKSLPYKLHLGMRWVVHNVPHVNWVVKADDDHIVRVKLLQFFVLRKFNPLHPIVIGGIVVGAPPHRTGKWAEDPKFTEPVYPPWAFGSAGYIVSRAVAEYVGKTDKLYYYQGEDAGLGIWLNESPLQVTFIDTPELNKEKHCDPKYYIIGHDWPMDQFAACYNAIGDSIPDRKSIVSFDAGRKDQHPGKIQQW